MHLDRKLTFGQEGIPPVALANWMDVTWEPKEDITTYELALAVGVIVVLKTGNPGMLPHEYLETQPEGVRRHFLVG